MKTFYVDAQGVEVPKEAAACLRIDCDCGEHRLDVPVAQITDQTTKDAEIYFVSQHAPEPKEVA